MNDILKHLNYLYGIWMTSHRAINIGQMGLDLMKPSRVELVKKTQNHGSLSG